MKIRLWSQMAAEERVALLDEVRSWIGDRSLDDISWKTLAREFSLSNAEGIRRILDPAWAENLDERTKLRRAGITMARSARGDDAQPHYTEPRPHERDVAARLAEIPPDTRSITGYLMGDPLPGRRAIDRVQ